MGNLIVITLQSLVLQCKISPSLEHANAAAVCGANIKLHKGALLAYIKVSTTLLFSRLLLLLLPVHGSVLAVVAAAADLCAIGFGSILCNHSTTDSAVSVSGWMAGNSLSACETTYGILRARLPTRPRCIISKGKTLLHDDDDDDEQR